MNKTIEKVMEKQLPAMPVEKRVQKAKRTAVGVYWCLLGLVLVSAGIYVLLKGMGAGTLPILLGFGAGLYGSNIISGEAARAAGKSTAGTISSIASSVGGFFRK